MFQVIIPTSQINIQLPVIIHNVDESTPILKPVLGLELSGFFVHRQFKSVPDVYSLCVILHAWLQCDRDQRRNIHAVTHGEVFVLLQRAYEEEQEDLVPDELVECAQAAVYVFPLRHIILNKHNMFLLLTT